MHAADTGGCKRSTTDSGYQEEEFEELIGEEEKKEPTKEIEIWDSEKVCSLFLFLSLSPLIVILFLFFVLFLWYVLFNVLQEVPPSAVT